MASTVDSQYPLGYLWLHDGVSNLSERRLGEKCIYLHGDTVAIHHHGYVGLNWINNYYIQGCWVMSSSFEYSIQRTRLYPACSRYTCRNYHKLLANVKKQGIQFHTRQSYWTGSKRLMIIKLSSAALVKTYMYTSVYIYGPETSLRIARIARKIVGRWTHTLPEYSYKL